jgi:hypothetical protein
MKIYSRLIKFIKCGGAQPASFTEYSPYKKASYFITSTSITRYDGSRACFPVQAVSVVYRLACWPLVPEFAGSNPAEAVGFFCMPSFGGEVK